MPQREPRPPQFGFILDDADDEHLAFLVAVLSERERERYTRTRVVRYALRELAQQLGFKRKKKAEK
jgi:hypothetical protein